MMNFNGIYECALHPRDASCDKDRLHQVLSLREELADVVWPPLCPWIGTDAWLLRFIDRAEDALLEPDGPDAEGKHPPRPTPKERVLATLAWREQNAVNDILETKDEAVLQIFSQWPIDIHGCCKKNGMPVIVANYDNNYIFILILIILFYFTGCL
jgi:hypothetical protein